MRAAMVGWMVAAALVLGGGAAAAAPTAVVPTAGAPAVSTTPMLVASTPTVSRDQVDVSGFTAVPVTVRVRVVRVGAWQEMTHDLTAVFTRLGDGPRYPEWPVKRIVSLHRVSGTEADGVYEGTLSALSTMNGRFVFSAVTAWDGAEGVEVAPSVAVAGPVLTVRGTHAPALVDVTTSPSPIRVTTRSVRIVGRVVDTTTGRPYPTPVPVYADSDSSCVEGDLAVTARTAATGAFSAPGRSNALTCVYLRPAARSSAPFWHDYLDRAVFSPAHVFGVVARPAATRVTAGHTVAVTGSVRMFYPGQAQIATVLLQRRYGDGTWRTVGRAKVTPRDTFRLTAQPPRRGTYSYRVALAAEAFWIQSTSRPFTIRAR